VQRGVAAALGTSERIGGARPKGTFIGVTFGEILLAMRRPDRATTSFGLVEGVTFMALDYLSLFAGCP
jgi:hypothetical protein